MRIVVKENEGFCFSKLSEDVKGLDGKKVPFIIQVGVEGNCKIYERNIIFNFVDKIGYYRVGVEKEEEFIDFFYFVEDGIKGIREIGLFPSLVNHYFVRKFERENSWFEKKVEVLNFFVSYGELKNDVI